MRDTDEDWVHISEVHPYFGVLTCPNYLPKNLDDAKLEEFYATGENDVSFVWEHLTRAFGAFEPSQSLDFGCGVGRLTLAMAQRSKHVIGVDVAPQMLALANQRQRDVSAKNVRFSHEIPDNMVDWINSYIVFQHIPPERGFYLLDRLLRGLRENGRVSLHFTIFRDSSVAQWIPSSLRFMQWTGGGLVSLLPVDIESKGAISMFDYDLNRVLAILRAYDIGELSLTPTNHGGHHGVWLFGRRIPTAVPPLAYDEIITFRSGSSGARYCVGGWSLAEEWGTWSDGYEAILRFRLHPEPESDSVLKVDALGFAPGNDPRREIDVLINGSLTATWVFEPGSDRAEHEVPLKSADLSRRRAVEVVFRNRHPKSPLDLGISSDARRLGIGIISLRVERRYGKQPLLRKLRLW